MIYEKVKKSPVPRNLVQCKGIACRTICRILAIFLVLKSNLVSIYPTSLFDRILVVVKPFVLDWLKAFEIIAANANNVSL